MDADIYDHSTGKEVFTKYATHASTAATLQFEMPTTTNGIDCGTSTYEAFSDAAATTSFSPSWITIDATARTLSFDIPASTLFGTTKISQTVYLKTTMSNGVDTLTHISEIIVIACTIVDY